MPRTRMVDERDRRDHAMREIREVAREVTGVRLGTNVSLNTSAGLMVFAAKSGTTGIAAGTTSSAGHANVTIQEMTTAGNYSDFLIPGTTRALVVRAYNLATEAVSGSRMLQLKQEQASGLLMVDFEACT